MLKIGYSYIVAPSIMIYIHNEDTIRLTENLKYYMKVKDIIIKYHKTYEFVANDIVIL